MADFVPDIVRIMRGFESGQEFLDNLRAERIRKSDILIDGPLLQSALDSAKFLKSTKPISGLVELRTLLSIMNK